MSVLFHTPAGGAAQRVQAGQVLDLTAPVLTDGVTVFRRTLYLRIALDGACDRVTLDSAALALRFEPCTVAVARGDADWVRRWQGSFGTVDVELAYPAPVTRVESTLYGKFELYRMDGAAVSTDPTATGNTGAVLPEPFSATAFEVRLCSEKPGLRMAEKHKVIAQKHAAHRTLSAAAVGVQMLNESELAMQDADRIVELVNGLSALHLAGMPGSPRLTLRSADGSETLWQWIEPGPQQSALDFAPATLAQDLQPALERALKLADEAAHAAGTPRPAVLVLPLELASDSPCRVRVQQANVTALLERPLLAQPASLRFDGAAREILALALTAPPGARRLAVQGQYATDSDAAPGTDAPAPAATGVYLPEGASASATLTLPAPLRCGGVAIGWHALGEHTTLDISLHAPADAPRPLAQASIETDRTTPGTLHARWPAADLQSGTCRVRVTVRQGGGVWAGAPGTSGLRLGDGSQDAGQDVAVVPDLTLLAPGNPNDPPPVTLRLGDSLLIPNPDAAQAPRPGVLDLKVDPVAPALAAQADWSLTVQATQPLTLTVESVRVAYTPN
ncbi:hypothetical protein [Immundisolibacter cernigliae]|uniref:Uncharacterized protein n=1 Tax=Immundisolibacter cernigliae TaxID=1810504 RepID=A0A1B1YWA8_9GAMM|nr:hypothetical protein [Immundisolibacter cernigliae]ANX05115.1 hypothetical protein PG2T_13620 [Immundisolibacter cernigliae]